MFRRPARLAALAAHVSLVAFASIAAAAPSANYDPATGRVKFVDLTNVWGLQITSPDPNFIPAGANPNRLIFLADNALVWEDLDAPFPATFLAGDIVTPDTPPSALHFTYLFGLHLLVRLT